MADPKITITAIDNTRAAFASIAGGLDKLKASAANTSNSFAALAGPITAAVGAIGAATAGLSLSISRALDTGDQLFKLSQKVGISVENLSELKFAADLSGVSLETLQKGIKDLSLVLVQANDASSKEAQLLKQLGVTAKEPEQALRQVADAFAKLPNGATKTAVAVELFKKAGQDLIPLLNSGSAALDAAGFSARRLGLAFTTDAARAAEQFNDNMLKLRTGAEAFGIALTSKLVAGMATFTGDLVKAKEQGINFKAVLDGILGTTLELATKLPMVGPAANFIADANARRIAEEQASIARRTSSGVIGGRVTEQVDPDAQAKLTCTLSGGTWDAKARRCIPKSAFSAVQKPLTFEEVLGRNAEKREATFQERESVEGKAAEDALQKALEDESRLALARARQQDEATRAAEDEYKATRALAQSYRDLASPMAPYIRQLEEIDALREKAGGLAEEEAKAAEGRILKLMENVGRSAKEAKSIGDELGMTFASAFEDAVVRGEKFRDVIKGLGQDIARIVMRKSVTEPIAKGISGFIENLDFGNFFKNFEFKADGGPVSGGRAYIVGEQGPELFVPRASGSIVPNSALRATSGAVVINNYFVDVDSAVRQKIAQATPSIVDASVARVADLRRRGLVV